MVVEILTQIKSLSSKVHITSQSSRFSDGDPAGIVYFANYPMYFDESFIDLAKQHGFDWGSRDMKFLIPIVEQKVTYKSPMTIGNQYYIITSIINKGNRSFKTGHILIFKSGDKYQLSASGYISRVSVDTVDFKPMQLPVNLSDALEKYLISDETWIEIQNLFL